MRKIIKISGYLFVTALVATIVIMTMPIVCNNNVELGNDTIKITDTLIQYDTIIVTKEIKVKEPAKIVYLEIPVDVDTPEILKNYYSVTFRDDTLVNDKSLFFRLQQEITKNNVKNQKIEFYDFENTQVITKETTIKEQIPAPKWYVGGFAMFSQNNQAFGVKLSYKTKKDIILSGAYGTNKTIMVDGVIPLNKLFTKQK